MRLDSDTSYETNEWNFKLSESFFFLLGEIGPFLESCTLFFFFFLDHLMGVEGKNLRSAVSSLGVFRCLTWRACLWEECKILTNSFPLH